MEQLPDEKAMLELLSESKKLEQAARKLSEIHACINKYIFS